jgi:hypothetical protein
MLFVPRPYYERSVLSPLKPFEGVAMMQGVKRSKELSYILIILAPAFAGAAQM